MDLDIYDNYLYLKIKIGTLTKSVISKVNEHQKSVWLKNHEFKIGITTKPWKLWMLDQHRPKAIQW